VRIKLQNPPRFTDRDLGEKLNRALQRGTFRQRQVMPQHDRNLRPDRLTGLSEVIGSCGISAMRRPSRLRRSGSAIAKRSRPLESNRASAITAFAGNRPSTARRASICRRRIRDQSPHLARANLQAGATQHIGCVAAPADRDMQIMDGKNGGHLRCTGSSAARRPSPRRLKPMTLRMTLRIGSAMIQGDW